jgi:hypothetical protein
MYWEDASSRLPDLPAISALNLPPLPAVQLPRGSGAWVPAGAPGLPPTQEDPQAETFQAFIQVAGKTFQVRSCKQPLLLCGPILAGSHDASSLLPFPHVILTH